MSGGAGSKFASVRKLEGMNRALADTAAGWVGCRHHPSRSTSAKSFEFALQDHRVVEGVELRGRASYDGQTEVGGCSSLRTRRTRDSGARVFSFAAQDGWENPECERQQYVVSP